MNKEDIKNYIEENLKRGHSPEEIKQTLLDAGWEEKKIEEIFSQVEVGEKERFPRNYLYIGLGAAIALFILFLLYFTFPKVLIRPSEKRKSTDLGTLEKMKVSCNRMDNIKLQKTCQICKRIKNAASYNFCIALVTNESEGCEMASWLRENCYLHLALRTKDDEYCQKIKASAACKALVQNNPKKCKEVGLKKEKRGLCYIYFAFKEGNSKFCNNLQDISEFMPLYCKALTNENERYCKSITGDLKKACLLKVAILKESTVLCRQLYSIPIKRKTCKALAKRKPSDLTCSGDAASICAEGIPYFQNASICERLPLDMQDKCYKAMVLKKLDIFPRKIYTFGY